MDGHQTRVTQLRKWYVFTLLVALTGLSVSASAQGEDSDTVVDIPDDALRFAVEDQLGKAAGDPITRGEMRDLSGLTAENVGQLEGIQYGVNLRVLRLRAGSISSLASLERLEWLEELDLTDNDISDIAALAGLIRLEDLNLTDNDVSDLSPLADLAAIKREYHHSRLDRLVLRNNAISDVSPVVGFRSLGDLNLDDNAISDLSAMREMNMTSLWRLSLARNEVADVAPIVDNTGFRGQLDLSGNPLGGSRLGLQIRTLRQRGVQLEFRNRDRERGNRLGFLWGEVSVDGSVRNAVLDGRRLGVDDLVGIELLSPWHIFLGGNRIRDITPLVFAMRFDWLTLDDNRVENWERLTGINMGYYGKLALDGNMVEELPQLPSELSSLTLTANAISDIGGLSDQTSLRYLQLDDNFIQSIEPLSTVSPRDLRFSNNRIVDITSLNLRALREVHMAGNGVRDISPLLNGERLLMVDVRRNPLADDALGVVNTLRGRRITVLAGETVPYFAAAGEGRQGFVRVVNRGDEAGHAFIEAVDDAGVRAGPLRIQLGAREAVHFNSTDLEYGSATKGLAGIGLPTAGDWRLSVISALDVEVLSYIRTDDGFVTAMHDVAADAMAPFFNPGSNRNQRSILRVVNTEAEPAKWTTGGYDDRGSWHPMTGSLLVRPQHALMLTAQELEDAHGLGDGSGKWRLRVRGFPWFAMSLLESPTGHLTNLSTAPAHTTLLEDGTTMHRLPLFPAAGGARQGFVRVINRSYAAGEVAIEAIDDARNRSGPVRITVDSRHAVHFNSADLEGGNAEKGLVGRVGDGEGDWRLELTSELDLMVLAYARTADGFLTSLHDLAPVAEDGSHRVVFFNPGSNTNQVSRLRVINDGGRPASVGVTGIDDRGVDSGMVAFRVPAGSALGFTAAELEAGDERRLAGSLGDGAGKWRLRVVSNEPIAVMSLLETPSGHLTNVSTGTLLRGRRAPRTSTPIPDQHVVTAWDPYRARAVGEATMDLAAYFEGDRALAFSATSSDPEVVGASVAGSVLTLTVVANGGRTTISVTVRDADGYIVDKQEFEVVVIASEPAPFQDCPECPQMVVVPAGSFMKGAPEEEVGSNWFERPVHQVDFAAPFAIGAFEVTFEQWDACVAAGGCDGYEPEPVSVLRRGADRANRPVQELSWHDAQAYVAWLSERTGEEYRLPTESEWEYAARAGTTTPFHFGETISTDQANYNGDAYGDGNAGEGRWHSTPVGSFPANLWGLHDVHGNVAEWTLDCLLDGDYLGAPTDGSAWQTGDCSWRRLRGGHYGSYPNSVRSASRGTFPADYRLSATGIRVVRVLGDPSAATVEGPDAQ